MFINKQPIKSYYEMILVMCLRKIGDVAFALKFGEFVLGSGLSNIPIIALYP